MAGLRPEPYLGSRIVRAYLQNGGVAWVPLGRCVSDNPARCAISAVSRARPKRLGSTSLRCQRGLWIAPGLPHSFHTLNRIVRASNRGPLWRPNRRSRPSPVRRAVKPMGEGPLPSPVSLRSRHAPDLLLLIFNGFLTLSRHATHSEPIPMSNTSGVQAACRTYTGATSGDPAANWLAVFDAAGTPAGDFNGRMLSWINTKLSASHSSLAAAQQAYAVSEGFNNWGSMNTVTLP